MAVVQATDCTESWITLQPGKTAKNICSDLRKNSFAKLDIIKKDAAFNIYINGNDDVEDVGFIGGQPAASTLHYQKQSNGFGFSKNSWPILNALKLAGCWESCVTDINGKVAATCGKFTPTDAEVAAMVALADDGKSVELGGRKYNRTNAEKGVWIGTSIKVENQPNYYLGVMKLTAAPIAGWSEQYGVKYVLPLLVVKVYAQKTLLSSLESPQDKMIFACLQKQFNALVKCQNTPDGEYTVKDKYMEPVCDPAKCAGRLEQAGLYSLLSVVQKQLGKQLFPDSAEDD